MGLRSLPAIVTFLDQLLGVVPGAAAGGHRDGDEQTGDDHPHQHGSQAGEGVHLAGDHVDDDEQNDRREHRQQRRYDHLFNRRLGEDVDGAAVFGLHLAGHDARVLTELTTDFLNDRLGRAPHGGHGHPAEQEGQQPPYQQAHHHVRVRKVEGDRAQAVEERPRFGVGGEVLQVLGVGGEQHQSAQTRRADGIALGDRLGRVADRVQGVGGHTNFRRQAGHFCDTAGVVSDRTEGVQRDNEARQRQHGRGGDGDAEQTRQAVGDDDADDDDQRRRGGGFQRHGQALDDVSPVARDRSLGHRLHRTEPSAGVVLGDHHNQGGDNEAGDAAPEQAHRVEGLLAHRQRAGNELVYHPVDREHRQNAGDDQALVESAHDVIGLAQTHGEGADDRGQDAHPANRQRQQHHVAHDVGVAEEDGGENHGGDRGHRIGLEQVGRHAGAVTDIVTDVVGDGGGVAGVVFGDASLDLADHVAADVSALGEDAAAQTGENRDQRSPEAQGDHRVDHFAAGVLVP